MRMLLKTGRWAIGKRAASNVPGPFGRLLKSSLEMIGAVPGGRILGFFSTLGTAALVADALTYIYGSGSEEEALVSGTASDFYDHSTDKFYPSYIFKMVGLGVDDRRASIVIAAWKGLDFSKVSAATVNLMKDFLAALIVASLDPLAGQSAAKVEGEEGTLAAIGRWASDQFHDLTEGSYKVSLVGRAESDASGRLFAAIRNTGVAFDVDVTFEGAFTLVRAALENEGLFNRILSDDLDAVGAMAHSGGSSCGTKAASLTAVLFQDDSLLEGGTAFVEVEELSDWMRKMVEKEEHFSPFTMVTQMSSLAQALIV